MNNIDDNPRVGNTNFPEQPPVQKKEITGAGTQQELPGNAEEVPTQTPLVENASLKVPPQLPPKPNDYTRFSPKYQKNQKNPGIDTKTVKIKPEPPVWQKIGAGLKSAGKAIGVIALGALAIALLPLTIVGLVISTKADNKVMDIKGEANAMLSGEESDDSLASKQKVYAKLIGQEDPSNETVDKLVELKREIQGIENAARPWEILAIVGNIIAFPFTGIDAILKKTRVSY